MARNVSLVPTSAHKVKVFRYAEAPRYLDSGTYD